MSLKGLILQVTVLICLTGILPQTFVRANKGDHTKAIDNLWPVFLEVKDDIALQKIMTYLETQCKNDIASNKLGSPISVPIADLSIAEVPPKQGIPPKYTALSNLHEITDCVDMVLIIPGYKTSVKRDTPKIVVDLTYYIRENRRHKTIYVFDCNEHFKDNYEDSVLKISDLGTKLGENLTKMPFLLSLHIIGIDLGANIAVYASRAFNSIKKTKVNRLTALNPATICIDDKGVISKDLADFVDLYRTSDFYGYNEKDKDLASIIFQIRDEKAHNTHKTFIKSTAHAINVYLDALKFAKSKHTIKECKDKKFETCDKILPITAFGYAKKPVSPTDGNYVTILAEPK